MKFVSSGLLFLVLLSTCSGKSDLGESQATKTPSLKEDVSDTALHQSEKLQQDTQERQPPPPEDPVTPSPASAKEKIQENAVNEPIREKSSSQDPDIDVLKNEIEQGGVHQHKIWDDLLKKYVTPTGEVNYAGLNTVRTTLNEYLTLLQNNPVQNSWTRSQKLAYWINAYNAFTVVLILDNYPLASIRDIQRPWGKKFIKLGDETYSLNQIEHDIIRPTFKEPRIHFAVVCAAVSCPRLLNQAYLPETLDQQLDLQTRYFLNESGKNELSTDLVQVSQLFNWYGKDFTEQGSIVDFIKKYSDKQISAKAKVEFLDYDWSLND